MRLAPLPQANENREKVPPLFRQRILPIGAAVGSRDQLENTQFDQHLQACRQHSLGDAEVLLKIAKPAQAVERVADDQQGPPVADHIQRPRDRAVGFVKTDSLHSNALVSVPTGLKIRLDKAGRNWFYNRTISEAPMENEDAAATGQATSGDAGRDDLSRPMILAFAVTCGLSVANIYYAQPLLDAMARALDIAPAAIGIVVTLTQVGYALGLMLIVPLGDLMDRRRLILGQTTLSAIALIV